MSSTNLTRTKTELPHRATWWRNWQPQPTNFTSSTMIFKDLAAKLYYIQIFQLSSLDRNFEDEGDVGRGGTSSPTSLIAHQFLRRLCHNSHCHQSKPEHSCSNPQSPQRSLTEGHPVNPSIALTRCLSTSSTKQRLKEEATEEAARRLKMGEERLRVRWEKRSWEWDGRTRAVARWVTNAVWNKEERLICSPKQNDGVLKYIFKKKN